MMCIFLVGVLVSFHQHCTKGPKAHRVAFLRFLPVRLNQRNIPIRGGPVQSGMTLKYFSRFNNSEPWALVPPWRYHCKLCATPVSPCGKGTVYRLTKTSRSPDVP